MMATPAKGSGATTVERLQPLDEYNYEHFRTKHFVADLARTARGEGAQPGREAPDFELESTDGGRVRLGDLRGKPALLHFGSIT